ncbi:MAG: hypothetical protein HDR43_03310, partial [Mycoplasma sp.]|nr:hypothetical protein [Mycoplasma sp.]
MFSNTNSNNNPSVLGWDFSNIFTDINNNPLDWNNRDDFKKDLYYQDMISIGNNNDILWFYMPNPLKMKDKNKNNLTSINNYSNFIFSNNNPLAKVFLIRNDDVENAKNNNSNMNIYDITNTFANLYVYSSSDSDNIVMIAPLIPISRHQQGGNNRYFKIINFTHNKNNDTALAYQAAFGYNGTDNISHSGPSYSGNPNLFTDSSSSSVFKFDSNGFNSGWKTWTSEFNNAMLIPTRNMFNENVVTFAYPYASPESSFSNSVVLPIFNIWQLSITDQNAGNTNSIGGGSFTKAFNFGKEIYDAYTANNWGTQSPTSAKLMWYPWPGAVNYTSLPVANGYFSRYTNQLYNRLINVSPYDNTIVYAARPTTVKYANITGTGDFFNGNSSYSNNYTSFWIGDSNSSNTNVYNFIISNIGSSTGWSGSTAISSALIFNGTSYLDSVNTIYQNGFWFDINSLNNNNINLYFNVTGDLKNNTQTNKQVKSSPIGLVRPNLSNSYNINSLMTSSPLTTINSTSIRNTNYSNYITSRADLTKWYSRTYQSLTQGANSYSNNFQINNGNSNNTKLIANNFGSTLSNLNSPNNNSVELFSNWSIGSLYNNVVQQSFKVVTNIDTTKQATPTLDLLIKYEIANLTNNFISTNDINKAKTIEIPITIPNLSWQFLNSWSTNAKLNNYTSPSNDNILGNMNVNWISNSNGQGNYGDNFASQNNMGYWVSNDGNLTFESITSTGNSVELSDTIEINKYPLRVVFAINPDPDNNLSSDNNANSWLTKFKNEGNGKFTKKYPLVSFNDNETNFNDILKEYANWKAQNLTYSSDVNNPSLGTLGLGQITIDAYLELNPYWDKLNNEITIYTLPENTNTKILIDKTTNIKYIYKDDYQNSRSIYKQNSTTFSDNNQSGFGNSNAINSSWVTTPSSSLNLKMPVDPTKVKNVLVREENGTTNDIFTAKYVEGSTNIILEPKTDKVDWAKTHLPTYSLMTGTGIIFEYKTKGSSEWQSFNTANGNLKYNENTGSYTITNSNKDIESIRFKLSPLSSNDNGNIVTKYDNWNNDNIPNTFISDEVKLEVIQINVDYTWFNNATLAFQGEETWNKFLNDENGEDQFVQAINTYETSIKNNINNLSNNNKDIVQIKYSLNEDDSTYVGANDLYSQLKQKWENYSGIDGGIVALYNEEKLNNTSATKIYVKFELNDDVTAGNYEFNEANKQGNNYIKKTSIDFKINLKSYVDVLQSIKTNVIQTSNGSITDFTPPAMTGDGFLGGKTFDQIVDLLKKFGVGVQYKKIDNSYTENKSEITSYDPANPIIKIRFTTSNNCNVKVSTSGSGTISLGSSDIWLPLNVPLLIQWSDSILDDFKTNFITGNTKNINIDQGKEQELIQKIAEFNNKSNSNNSNKDLWDNLSNYLEIKYAIGESNSITSYYYRQDFIDYLNSLTTTQYNNQINIKLVLKDETNNETGEAKFLLSSEASKNHILYENKNNYIKIFIVNNYTNLFDQITISGTTNNLTFGYPEQLQKIKDNEIAGLKIAYSLKQNINYDDKVNENDGNIENEWVITQPNSVPTSAKILKIKIYTTNESLYIFEGNIIGDIDLTKIAKPIDVDSNWFNEIALTINSNNNYLKDIQIEDITNWENQIWEKSKAIQSDSSLRQYVSIKYNIDGNGSYSAQELLNELKKMQNDYSSSTLGIVYLWDGSRGTKINATFTTSDPQLIMFTNADDDSQNSNLTGTVQTNQIKTYIDLSNYANILKTNKTSVQLIDGKIGTIQSFTPPTITGDGFLGGKTFDQISEVLSELGVEFKFNNNLNESWNIKNDVNEYNTNNAILYLGVEYNSQIKPNIVFDFGNNSIIENTTLNKGDNALVILQLQAPVAIIVDLSQLGQLSFQGNTKNIDNATQIKNKINEIINNVKSTNSSAITNNDLNLEIRFSLNELKLEENISDQNVTDDGIWYTFEKLNEILSRSTTNYNNNKVVAKFYIKNNPILEGGVYKYQLSTNDFQIINNEDLINKSDFNIYINNTDQIQIDWIEANLKLSGSQENFDISNFDNWKSNLPQGLTVQFNITPSSNIGSNGESQPDDSAWKDDLNDAKPINTTRDFWIRFKVGDAYVFESASQSNPSYSNPIKLDASAISVSLKIQSNWLNQVILTGNLKDLIINESQAIEAIKSAGQMPIENIIQIEYTYDGNNWLKAKEFEAKLQELKGSKDNENNWIILREDIEARFVLNKEINNNLPNKYVLEIDDNNIEENNSNNINVSLITNSINQNVKGYINLDKFNEFNANNFKVTGTNSSANLITSNINDINAKLNPYSSNNIFSILYKWNSNDNYLEANKIWTPGQEIQEITKLNGTYENRFFGIQFKVDSNDYVLYQNDKEQSGNSYEISTATTPAIQMQISVEIINPFISTNSNINIKFLDTSSKPQWYNNDGAFTFTIEEPQTNGGTQIYNSFNSFISNLGPSYTQEMRDALELVYYVSATELSEEEYQQVTSINEINKYDKSSEKYNVWKELNDSNDISQLNYHLKVGDYVIIALRIKEDSLTTDTNPNGYVLKDNDHSPTKAIRVSGYKVHTSNIDVDWNSMKLRNIGLAESASYGLDGYAMLDQISLKQSSSSNNSNDYLNVSLKLNYFTEFYVDNNGQVLVSGSGSRLEKRDSSGITPTEYYKDSEGQEIKDNDGKPIPILYKPGE